MQSSRPQRGVCGAAPRAVSRQPGGRRPGLARGLRERRRRAARLAARLWSVWCRGDGKRRGTEPLRSRRRATAPPPAAVAAAAPAPEPEPAPAAPDGELVGAVAAAMSLVKAYRTHGHLNARLDPLGSEPMGDPALDETRLEPPLTPDLQARIPARLLRLSVPGETLARRVAAPARGLQRHDRLRDRAHLGPRRARLAPAGHRVGPVSGRALADEKRELLRRLAQGGGVRDLPAARVHRTEAVLHRGARRARAHARRGGRARSAGRRARGRSSASLIAGD